MSQVKEKALAAQVNIQTSAQRVSQAVAAKALERCAESAGDEEGSTTVEYALGAVATAGFAGLLLAVLKSGSMKNLLNGIMQSVLGV